MPDVIVVVARSMFDRAHTCGRDPLSFDVARASPRETLHPKKKLQNKQEKRAHTHGPMEI